MTSKFLCFSFIITLFASQLSASLTNQSTERESWTEGHGDLAVAYENGEFSWSWRNGETPSENSLRLDHNARLEIPDLPAFEFLGAAGDPIWIIPQTETDGVAFMGVSVDVSSGTFAGNRLNLSLAEFHGPGHLLMWSAQSASNVEVLFNTRDGMSNADAADIPAPGHSHRNWGFTAPGTYDAGFAADGTLAAGGEPVQSESGPIYRFQVNVLDLGEADLEIVYENGEWKLAILQETIDEKEFEASEAALHAGPAARQFVPGDPAFGFLGRPGDSVFILPQEEREGVLFLGVAGDEISPGTFVDDEVSLHLIDVEGPGEAFLYSVDAFGAPKVFFNSSDGIDASDAFPVAVGGHFHQNWAFTAPGFYRMTLRAEGRLAASGSISLSEPTLFYFEAFGTRLEDSIPGLTMNIKSFGEESMTLQFNTKVDNAYQLQSRTEMRMGQWANQGDPIPGEPDFVEITIPIDRSTGRMFYRVVEQ